MNLPKKRYFRLETFDLLRGFYILGIVVNHLALYPNLLMFITGATRLWVSFAEGFFAISGFFIGFLYRKKLISHFGEVAKKLSRRSIRLYAWSVYLTWFFTYWGNIMPKESVKDSLWLLRWDNLPLYLVKTLTLQYSYGWADILPVYTVLIFLSIGALWLVSRKRTWLLGIVSLVLWSLFRKRDIVFAVMPIYFGGLMVGFYYSKIKYYLSRLSIENKFKLRTVVYGIFLLTLLINIFSVFGFEKFVLQFANADFWIRKNQILNWYFDKQTVGLGRLLLSPLWIVTGYLVFESFKKKIKKYFGWFLFVFGRNSLYSYIIHALLIYPVPFFMGVVGANGVVINTLVSLAMVTWVYIFTYLTANHFKGKF